MTHAASRPMTIEGLPGSFIVVPNVVGLARQQGVELLRVLRDDPEAGSIQVHAFARELTEAVRAADPNGVLYLLEGAHPAATTPMEYGGHFLEVDRAILSVADPTRVAIFVEGRDAYLDFVSDLPGFALGWDTEQNDVSLNQMEHLRPGPFFTRTLAGGFEVIRHV